MREFNDNDIKIVGLEVMDAVHNFCVEHNLRYSIFYGTLLGAIRHKGYIPWDDDIDIVMPRDDYEYLIHHFDNERYGVQSCFTHDLYTLPYAKAYDKKTLKVEESNDTRLPIGFNIDIFPLDQMVDYDEYWKIRTKEKSLIRKWTVSIFKVKWGVDKPARYFYFKFMYLFTKGKANKYSRLIDQYFIKRTDKSKKKTVYARNEIYKKEVPYVFPLDLFDNLLLIDFEDRKYYATPKYDESLKKIYGDYMKLPPKEQQVTHHGFLAYFLDD